MTRREVLLSIGSLAIPGTVSKLVESKEDTKIKLISHKITGSDYVVGYGDKLTWCHTWEYRFDRDINVNRFEEAYKEVRDLILENDKYILDLNKGYKILSREFGVIKNLLTVKTVYQRYHVVLEGDDTNPTASLNYMRSRHKEKICSGQYG